MNKENKSEDLLDEEKGRIAPYNDAGDIDDIAECFDDVDPWDQTIWDDDDDDDDDIDEDDWD